VKNCHLMREAGFAEFPDCVAARSAKHLYELADMAAAGARAALVYVIQMDANRFDVARDIDPAYDKAFRHALAAGVESYAYICRISPEEVVIDRPVEIVTPR
jgi:sugar fermentation stimulation protein A